MAGMGRRLRVECLKYISNQTPAASPAAWNIGFSTANPGDDGQSVAEPTIGTGGYARQAVAWAAVATPANGAPAVLQNSGSVSFGPSSAAWSTGATPLTHVAYWTGTTGTSEATFLASGAVSVPPSVAASQTTLTSSAGSLQVTITPT